MYKTNAGLYFLSTLKDDDIKVIDPTTDLYVQLICSVVCSLEKEESVSVSGSWRKSRRSY